MKILCFGDSNTYGYDPRGFFGGRYDRPWPEILAEKPGHIVMNRGENGREIPLNPVRFPADTDYLIVMLGTNDLLQGASPEAARDRMERFMRSVNVRRILLIAPPPMKMGEWVTHQKLITDSKTLADHYRALARRLGIPFADAGQWDIPLAYDGVHFTGEGHEIFAARLSELLQNIHF